MTAMLIASDLRAQFAARLSILYSREVPAYSTLVQVTEQVNARVLASGHSPHLGGADRVSVERHGAIRVGSADELAAVARIYAAMGMHPVGFYDLRDSGVPVVSTAFRPIDPADLEINPFRVFTSMLALDDRSYFSSDLASRAATYLAQRQLFASDLLTLADRAIDDGGLSHSDAATFLDLAASAFQLTNEPIDRAWYSELEQVSAVAADIAGVPKTHINHLTPRVLDIDALWSQMVAQGIEMIPEIQGPPRWDGPDVLLRQTSFKALSEPRRFRAPDGTVSQGELRVRFGEVEARGVALTPEGLERYNSALALVEELRAADPSLDRQDALRNVWAETFPTSEAELMRSGLGCFTVKAVTDRTPDGTAPSDDVDQLLSAGFLTAAPTVYEDFLPRSAAGIFRSNLDADPEVLISSGRELYSFARLEGILGRTLFDPHDLYQQQTHRSIERALNELGISKANP